MRRQQRVSMKEANRGEKRKKVAVSNSEREGGAKRQGFGDLREDAFEELDATIDTFVWFPELET